MATDLKTHAQNVSLTRFWGGDNKGSCVQVTTPACNDNRDKGRFFDSVQLTRAQAAALAADLLDFAQGREKEVFGEQGLTNGKTGVILYIIIKQSEEQRYET